MIDGVNQLAPSGATVFHPPTDQEVAAMAELVYRKVARLLGARGDDEGPAFASAEPMLATLAGASVTGVAATGLRRGARTLRVGSGTASGRPRGTLVPQISGGS